MNGDLNYAYDVAYYSNEIFSNFFFLFNIYFILIIELVVSHTYVIDNHLNLITGSDKYSNCFFLFNDYDCYFFSNILAFFLW